MSLFDCSVTIGSGTSERQNYLGGKRHATFDDEIIHSRAGSPSSCPAHFCLNVGESIPRLTVLKACRGNVVCYIVCKRISDQMMSRL